VGAAIPDILILSAGALRDDKGLGAYGAAEAPIAVALTVAIISDPWRCFKLERALKAPPADARF
jgi:hypothetical protein